LTDRSLSDLIKGCRLGQQTAQKTFYERFHGYALSICLAYASDREDAREILNDGFLKVFAKLTELKNEDVLLPWLRRIMVNTAIDYYRKNLKRAQPIAPETLAQSVAEPYLNDEAIFAQLSAEHILAVLQQLPLSCRMVFSLYVLEGYSHAEIAARLTIGESTSRAYLTEANRLLRRALTTQLTQTYERPKR